MLVIDGFFENGVFIPEKPLANITGRQRAVLNIDDTSIDEKHEHQKAWQEFSQAIRASDEVLEGEPERLRFKMPEDIDDGDLLTAAYCIKNGYTLVSNNLKHFEKIETIQVVNWT
jgi:predicted nucleic acid-binding protein